MPRILVIGIVAGIISGLLVGGFHNLFTVPVMERAIALEEERSSQAGTVSAGAEEGDTPVSLGVQRLGMVIGTAIYGLVLGVVFAGGFELLRRAKPHWNVIALAATVGVLGFWAVSLFPFMKYPANPPGVGQETTLLSRQLFQVLFIVLSAGAIAAGLAALSKIGSLRLQSLGGAQVAAGLLLVYGVFAAIIFLAFPGNPDPAPVPLDLLELFRALTMVGQFLLWAFLAAGVALAVMRQQGREALQPTGSGEPAATSAGLG